MKILILGAGKMGSFFTDLLSFNHDVAVYEPDPQRLRFIYHAERLFTLEQISQFDPEFVINCVSLDKTQEAFIELFPYISEHCIISDIASVKGNLKEFYINSGRRYISVHPMFGPTFARLDNLSNENAIIISDEGTDSEGLEFFKSLFATLKLNVREYTFDQHDEIVAYSLSIPFASTLVFGAVMEHIDVPGTTFKKHLAIAKGLMDEDDFLLSEILFNRFTKVQLSKIIERLTTLSKIVDKRDSDAMREFLDDVRTKIA